MQNNRSTFGLLFYLNTGKTKKSGKCPIMGRISVDGKNTAFSTGIDICPADWDANSGFASGKSNENHAINKQIENFKAKGLIRQNPFLDYVQEKAFYKIKWLSNSEIERPSANFIRDMFLFAVFTGISFIDLKNLKHSNIKQQDDGSKWIVFNRQKTGTASYIPLLDIPQKILEKYQHTKFAGMDGKVFRIGTLVNFNLHLKV